MRKLIEGIFIVCITLILASCSSNNPTTDGILPPEKPDKETPGGEDKGDEDGKGSDTIPSPKPVKPKAKFFNIDLYAVPLNLGADKELKQVDYFIYNKINGKLIKQNRLSVGLITGSNKVKLASLRDSLPAGQYSIRVIASTKEEWNNKKSRVDDLQSGFLYFDSYIAPIQGAMSDFGMSTEADTSLKIDLLNLVGLLKVQIADIANVPASLTQLEFDVLQYGKRVIPDKLQLHDFKVKMSEVQNTVPAMKTVNIAELKKMTSQTPISIYLLGDEVSKLDVSISCKFQDKKQDKSYLQINALDKYRNKQISLTCDLFGKNDEGSGGLNSSIKVNSEWDRTVIETFN